MVAKNFLHKVSVLVIVLIFFSFNLSSADFHKKGDFHLSLRAPFAIPIFTSELKSGGQTYTFWDTGYKNIDSGVEADVGIFRSPNTSIGGLIGYRFAYDRGDNLFSKIPLLFKYNYFPVANAKQEIPLSFAVGINYFKYRSMEHIVPQIGFETGFNVYWSASWSALFRVGFNLYAELYASGDKTNLSGTLPIVLGVTYRR